MEEMVVNMANTFNEIGKIVIEMNCYGVIILLLLGFSAGVLAPRRGR